MALNPVTGAQVTDQPQTIIDDNGGNKTSVTTLSVYLQDEWKLLSTDLVLNYGLRFDQYDGFRHENQLSPRINAVWHAALSGTTLHAGYARYFSPPPFELVGSETVSKFLNTTAAAAVAEDTTPLHRSGPTTSTPASPRPSARGVTLGIDSYYKTSKDLIDEGQFGAPIILTPFNYAVGRQYGVEFEGAFHRGPWSAYANFAYARAQGRDITSSQFNFRARRAGLYRQPFHPSRPRPDLYRLGRALLSVAWDADRRRSHLRQRPARHRSGWRPQR